MSANADSEVQLTPYARSLGIRSEHEEDDMPVLSLDFSAQVEGRPGAFHGGATSGLLETAGYAALRRALRAHGRDPQLKPITITVEFLSAGKQKKTYATGRIIRLGRRIANLSVEAWQDDRKKPIASAIMNILMASE